YQHSGLSGDGVKNALAQLGKLAGEQVGIEIQDGSNIRALGPSLALTAFVLRHRLAQRDTDNATQVVRSYAFAVSDHVHVVWIGNDELRTAADCITQSGARDGAVVVNPLAVLVAPRRQAKRPVVLAQEDETSLRIGKGQGGFQ